MSTPDFTHLHCHSEYSLLDGLARIEPLLDSAQKHGMTSLALTDHGVMFGAIEFYQAAKKRGIKPIIGCCLPGQLIYTENGVRPIESIQAGDRVLTHNGRFRPVVRTMSRQYSGALYGLRAANCSTVWLTDEHPVLIRKRRKEDLEWIRADALEAGRHAKGRLGTENWNSYVGFPRLRDMRHDLIEPLDLTEYLDHNLYDADQGFIHKSGKFNKWDRCETSVVPARVPVTPELMRLLGLFVAEGSFQCDPHGRPTTLVFPLNSHHKEDPLADFIISSLTAIFGVTAIQCSRPERSLREVYCRSSIVARLFFALCGSGCANKRIPSFVYATSKNNIQAFVDGLVDGDGKRDLNTGHITLKMTSRDVIYGTRLLISALGYAGAARQCSSPKRPAYIITWSPQPAYRRHLSSDEFLFLPLKEVGTRWYEGNVFNLEVAEDNSYVTDFAVHNCEAYVAPRGMTQREGKQDASGYHQVLLAENETGYRNLLRLTTEAQLRGYYYKPRIDKELLEKHCEGLIATSTCLSAEVPRHLLRDDLPAAKRALEWYAEHFPGRFYLELQDHQLPDQHRVNERLLELSKHYNLPLVATNDVHYINQEHSWAQEVLLCVQTGVTVDDPKRMKMDSKEFYLKPAHEMWALFPNQSAALKNTMEIAERCTLDLEFGRVQLPEMPVPPGHTVDSYLAEVCHHRLAERYGEVTEELRRRLDYELAVIRKTGFAAYFLLLDDIIGFARREGIMVGPGRGSAVGSLASYCLGITNVDPMGYDLLFERFLNPDRLSMPDIDTDFADDRRDEVIRYITRRFGADCVAQISTFGTMAAKAAVKDVGRALGIPYGDVDRVAKLIPLKTSLDGALALPDMKSLYDNDESTKRLLDTARQLEDVKRHSSTHAAGVVISRDPLTSVTPLVRVGKEGEEGQATQYDAGVLEKVGLLKMDILGLTTLTLIQRTVRTVEQAQGVIVEPDEIPLDDPLIYQLLSAGDTAGIFQLESPPMRKVLRDMKPDRFTDIVAVVALYRPGPMNYIDQYVARKNGSERVTYLHPDLESILGNTYGIIVYQDQVLKIALEFAGFTWGDADKLRKAMGKKLVEEMKKQQDAFEAGFKSTTRWEYKQEENGEVVSHQVPKPAYPVDLARAIWPLIETFAGYGFNKCAFSLTKVILRDGKKVTLATAYREQPDEIMAMWPDGQIRPHKVQRIVKTGRKSLVKVITHSGRVIKATPEHRLLTTEGYKRIDEMSVGLELMTVPWKRCAPRVITEGMRLARRANITRINKSPEHQRRVSARVKKYQAGRPLEDKVAHMKRMHALYPNLTRHAVAAMHERWKWLWANDPAWRERFIATTLASTTATFGTGPGYGYCSIASNGMWCASWPERDMCEWLIAQGVEFEIHKALPNGRVCDFYFAGIYWEMDGMDRAPAYFADKYGDLPYVVVTPEDFRFVVEHHLSLAHARNGDPIISIEPWGEGQTYDVEMAPDGPLNFIANDLVSHNSHAAAYAQLACQTAYLKAKFKVEYMAASLSIETGTPDRMTVVLGECRRLGIAIRPPDVNHSELDFSVEDGAVRYALQAVKNVGAGAIRSIVDARHEGGPFRDLDDFCRRVDWKFLNKRALESLVKAGAMDTLNTGGGATGLANRSLLLGNLDAICSQAQRASRAADAGQISLFAAAEDVEALGMPSITLQTAKEYTQKELLAWEKEMLGLYVSEHPLSAFLAQSSHLGTTPISTITPALAGKRVKVGAQVVGMRQILTKKNETMLVLELEDLERTIEAVAFPRTYARFRELWQEEAILLIEGNVDVRNDRLQLIVEEASVFENKVGSGAERWTINVPRSGNNERDLARLQDAYLLLQQYMPGPNRVDLMTVVEGRHVPIRLPGSDLTFNCCPELLERVRAILGANAVEATAAAPLPPTPVDDLPIGGRPLDWARSTPDDPYGDMPLPVDADADAELAYVYG